MAVKIMTMIRKHERGGRIRTQSESSYCLPLSVPASCSCSGLLFFAAFPSLGISLTPTGRALLIGALLLSAYVLLRYWRSLDGRSRNIRFSLVSVRAIAFLLISGALAGAAFEYETTVRARILLRSTSSKSGAAEDVNDSTSASDKSRDQLTARLTQGGFEVVEHEGEDVDDGFLAAALLTDGAMSSADAQREVERMNARVGGAPVYVISEIAQTAGATIVLESVTMLGPAIRGVPASVRCNVHARGMLGRESLITISDDAKAQASARIGWTSDDERKAITLKFVPKVSGWLDYRARVEGVGGEGQSRLSRSFSLHVEERRLRVLFFEGEPTWESKFIRRALEQSGLFDVDYFAQVSRAATVGTSSEAEGRQPVDEDTPISNPKARDAPETKLHATLQSPARLAAYECVFIGASPNTLLSSSESGHLSAWVERRGGGLVVLGGNNFNGSIAAPGGKLYSILPAEVGTQDSATQSQEIAQGRPLEAEQTRGKFFLTPTEEGAQALSGYSNTDENTIAKAASLTGQGLRLGALRPGATILAVAGQPGANGTSDVGQPLIAGMRFGSGRTLVFAPADSWRIRTSASGEEDRTGGAFNALWEGIVLWASAGARPQAEIVLSDESPTEGSEVTVELRVRDASFTSLKIDRVNARLQPLREESGEGTQTVVQAREVAFAPDVADASVWRTRLRLNERGKFALEAEYVAAGKTGIVEKRFAIVSATLPEVGAAYDTLRRLSMATGGDVVDPAEIDSLVGRLSASSSSGGTIRRTWELRTWWPLALIIPILLSGEWFLRRWWRID